MRKGRGRGRRQVQEAACTVVCVRDRGTGGGKDEGRGGRTVANSLSRRAMFASADDNNEVCALPPALLPACSATFPATQRQRSTARPVTRLVKKKKKKFKLTGYLLWYLNSIT